MKKVYILLFVILTGCSAIYGNKSFLYKSANDYKNMTLSDVAKIMSNGGDLAIKNTKGYTPLAMACINGTDAEVIKYMVHKGANPHDCNLYEFVKNKSSRNYSRQIMNLIMYDDIQKMLSVGIVMSPLTQEFIISKSLITPDELIDLLNMYKNPPAQYLVKAVVENNPLEYKKHMRTYGEKFGKKNIIMWAISSPFSKKYRNSKEWYELVDNAKELKIHNGIIGMLKQEYITNYGIPDKEYKMNNNTTVLVYTKEHRNNIPLTSNSYSSSVYFDITDTLYTTKTTYSRGGYTKTNVWQENVYIDKGIVTGIDSQDKVVTH